MAAVGRAATILLVLAGRVVVEEEATSCSLTMPCRLLLLLLLVLAVQPKMRRQELVTTARILSSTRRPLSAVEAGRRERPTWALLAALAEAVGLTPRPRLVRLVARVRRAVVVEQGSVAPRTVCALAQAVEGIVLLVLTVPRMLVVLVVLA